jgi:hypothetical protein
MTKEIERKIKKIVAIRKEMETDAGSINRPIKEAVKKMEWIILLRHCHPVYRKDYARRLVQLKQISEKESMEFN